MNRAQVIQKLMSEGFSEKTLVNFNDKQLEKFANKMLKEAQTVTTTKTVYNSKDPKDVVALNTALKDPKVDKTKIEVKETDKKWIQKAINPKKKGQLHKDLGVPKDDVIPVSKLKAAAKKGGKVGQRARMALNLKNLNEFVENIVDSNYHSLVTKADMVSLIKEKLNESNIDLKEKRVPRIPEFMSFDNIVSAGEKEAPEKEAPDVDAPPREKPDVDRPERDPRRSPFRNPNEEPVVEPNPKAKIKKFKSMPLAAE